MVTQPILKISHLSSSFKSGHNYVKVVDDLSLHINPGEVVGLVGESGSGKTVTALSILQLSNCLLEGSIELNKHELIGMKQEELRKIRGKKIGIIFQEPMSSLNPVFTIGKQIAEVIENHEKISHKQASLKAISLLENVGISQPDIRYHEYPHQMSGGMCQRVMIAMAIACQPQLLIADEPTTALDVSIQSQIITLLKDLKKQYTMSVLLITHDLGIVAQLADRVAVMYAGQIVENAPIKEFLKKPEHPYTLGLIKSLPGKHKHGEKLFSIPGTVPNPLSWPNGCRFHPRCTYVEEQCKVDNPCLFEVSPGRQSRCFFAGRLPDEK